MNLVNVLEFCENELGTGIPEAVGNLVHIAVLIIQVVVPVILILWGMLDFAKGVMGQDEDKIKSGQKKFIQRLIAAIFVFLIVVIVRLVITAVGNLGDNDAGTAWKCADELISGKKR